MDHGKDASACMKRPFGPAMNSTPQTRPARPFQDTHDDQEARPYVAFDPLVSMCLVTMRWPAQSGVYVDRPRG